jgi:hypothetical protein
VLKGKTVTGADSGASTSIYTVLKLAIEAAALIPAFSEMYTPGAPGVSPEPIEKVAIVKPYTLSF